MERTDDGEDAREDVRLHARARRRQRWSRWNLLMAMMDMYVTLSVEVATMLSITYKSIVLIRILYRVRLKFYLRTFHTG